MTTSLLDRSTPTRRPLFGFPEVVNETAARLVASGVVLMALAYLVTGSGWVLVPLAYGFVARVATGPRLSPLGRLVTEVVVPRIPAAERPTAGAPKRFAQGIGATLALAASIAHVAGSPTTAAALVAMIVAAASLEAAIGFCLGCQIYGLLIRAGIVPETVCEACSDLSRRPGFASPTP